MELFQWELLQLKKKFEVFVLTGQAEAYEDKTFKKSFTKVYKKGSDDEIDYFENLTSEFPVIKNFKLIKFPEKISNEFG